MAALLILLLLCKSFLCTANQHPRRRETHYFFALHLDPSITSPEKVSQVLGAQHEGQIGELSNHHKFSISKSRANGGADALLSDLKIGRRCDSCLNRNDDLDGILWSTKLDLREQPLNKRTTPPPIEHLDTSHWVEDPTAVQTQKHIAMTLRITDPLFHLQWHLFNTYQPGQDMNVTGVWQEGVTGNGTVTAIIDDGLDIRSRDLEDNYFPGGSYNFNEKNENPEPKRASESHGTKCAGEISASKNSVCGVGMAYDGKIAGIRLLSGPIDESDEAAALNYQYQENHIYSCSWGPPDDGKAIGGPGMLAQRALVNGAQNGRQGKGSVYIFSAGNAGFLDDDCNFDGYVNSIYTIAVGAIDREGNHAEYSESCSALLVVGYSRAGYLGDGLDAIYTTDIGVESCTSEHGGTSAAGPLIAGSIALALSIRPELTWRDLQYLLLDTAVPVHEEEDDWQMTATGKKFSHRYGYGKVDTYALVQRAREWPLVNPQAEFHSPLLGVHQDIPQGTQGVERSFEVTREVISNLARVEHVTVTMNVNHTRRGDLSVELHSPSGIISQLSTTRRLDNETVGYSNWTFMSVAHWGEPAIGNWTVIVKDTVINNFHGIFIDWQLNLWGEMHHRPSQMSHAPPNDITDDIGRPILVKPPPATETGVASADSLSPSAIWLAEMWIYKALATVVVSCIAVGIYAFFRRRQRHHHLSSKFDGLGEPDAMLSSRPRIYRSNSDPYHALTGSSSEVRDWGDEYHDMVLNDDMEA
ncbi:hypothetical protein FQN51_008226 [Onygenales sp. PD_10]|nr:hypothetical protein FQN51_008226 [Onygenales sp. PD_10]